MRVTVRAGALQRQLAVRKLRVVMEVEEKRAAAVMLLPTRAPMRVRSLEMEEMTVLVVSHPRETKERQREEMKERKREEMKERKREEMKERKREEMKERKRVEMKEKGLMRMELMTAELETTLVARAAQARDPRRPQLR